MPDDTAPDVAYPIVELIEALHAWVHDPDEHAVSEAEMDKINYPYLLLCPEIT